MKIKINFFKLKKSCITAKLKLLICKFVKIKLKVA